MKAASVTVDLQVLVDRKACGRHSENPGAVGGGPGAGNSPEQIGEVWLPMAFCSPPPLLFSVPLLYSNLLLGASLVPPPCFPSPSVSAPLIGHLLPWKSFVFKGHLRIAGTGVCSSQTMVLPHAHLVLAGGNASFPFWMGKLPPQGMAPVTKMRPGCDPGLILGLRGGPVPRSPT